MHAKGAYRRVFLAGAILALGAGLVGALALSGVLRQRLDTRTAPPVTLALDGGDIIGLPDDVKGRVVVINFFASWCPPCRDEAPALREVWSRIKDNADVVIVGVIYRDDSDAARRYLRDYDLGFAVVNDSTGALADAFRVSGIPKTFVIAPGGTVVLSHFGAIDAETLLAAIEEAKSKEGMSDKDPSKAARSRLP